MRIDRFSESTADGAGQAERSERRQSVRNDLDRDNPGGLLNQAIDVSDFFLR
jgi:C-terminal processing protease CtpA/Prc